MVLSKSQLKFVSEILSSMGQVFLASLVVQYFITNLDTYFLLSGVVLMLGSWITGLIIVKEVNI